MINLLKRILFIIEAYAFIFISRLKKPNTSNMATYDYLTYPDNDSLSLLIKNLNDKAKSLGGYFLVDSRGGFVYAFPTEENLEKFLDYFEYVRENGIKKIDNDIEDILSEIENKNAK